MEHPPKEKYFKSFWGMSFLFGQIVLSLWHQNNRSHFQPFDHAN